MLSVLNNCIDSLDLRVSRLASPSEWLLSQAEIWRKYKKDADFGTDPLLIELAGLGSWRLKFSGHHPYEFVLINPEICDIRIWNPYKWSTAFKGQTGQLYISFRSRFLQIAGLPAARRLIEDLHSVFFAAWSQGFCRVARADAAVDLQLEQGFQWGDIPKFVTRSRFKDIDTGSDPLQSACDILQRCLGEEGPDRITRSLVPTNNDSISLSMSDFLVLQQALETVAANAQDDSYIYRVIHRRLPQTLYFGRFGGACYARIYDKLASLGKQNKEYMREIWSTAGWDGEFPVWRFEFSMSGDFLKGAVDLLSEHFPVGELPQDLREFDIFLDSMPRIWQYLTQNWLRFTQPEPGDSNLWRAPLSPIWEVVQSAWPECEPVIRCRPPRNHDDEQLVAQLKGVALTIAARRSPTDSLSDETFSIAFDLVLFFETGNFQHLLRERRQLLGIDDLSDTQYSAEVRSQRMIQGNGS